MKILKAQNPTRMLIISTLYSLIKSTMGAEDSSSDSGEIDIHDLVTKSTEELALMCISLFDDVVLSLLNQIYSEGYGTDVTYPVDRAQRVLSLFGHDATVDAFKKSTLLSKHILSQVQLDGLNLRPDNLALPGAVKGTGVDLSGLLSEAFPFLKFQERDDDQDSNDVEHLFEGVPVSALPDL